MNRRIVLLALPAVLLLTAAAPRKAAPPAPLPDVVRVALNTDQGTITLDLDAKNAPITVRNFVRYIDQRKFDGIVFYRVMRLKWGEQPNGLIQAGTRDSRVDLPPIAHEATSQTGILHKAGTISMARFAPGTAKAQFTILLADMPGLDADPSSADPELKAGYAAFGQVTQGMEVVRKIYDLPVSPTAGQGALKGQMLARPVRVLTARRVNMPPPVPKDIT